MSGIESVTLDQAIDRGVVAALAAMWVTFPASVVAWDADTQTASVQPMLRQRRKKPDAKPNEPQDELYDPPVIVGVPVGFFGAGAGADAWSLAGPINAGDTGLCVCTQRSIADWKSTTEEMVTPTTRSMFAIADAIFIPLHIRPSTPLLSTGRASVDGTNNEATILRVPSTATLLLGSGAASQGVALGPDTVTAINGVISDYNSHTHVVAGITAGAASVVSAVTTAQATPLVDADITSTLVLAEKS